MSEKPQKRMFRLKMKQREVNNRAILFLSHAIVCSHQNSQCASYDSLYLFFFSGFISLFHLRELEKSTHKHIDFQEGEKKNQCRVWIIAVAAKNENVWNKFQTWIVSDNVRRKKGIYKSE